ncbi:hypothetical protein EDD40_0992 [Saccharothrix texasensis]|uniref:Uncharacterized protein n=1 Tax=Saccharothrix texasensis TaxID=103734 RepID=A0A3N1GZL4_9PSEU|nr:hypothetical protein EDD40_0992 [Saccharothrix texasensis]
MMTVTENSSTAARTVENEFRNLAEVRQNPPSKEDLRERLPQSNGDQDTW